MKKLFLLSAVLILGTVATWAKNGISFTIYPKASGNFIIYYSTYNAPSTDALQVDWGDGALHYYHDIVNTGSDPSKMIQGAVTVDKPIKIYCECLDAIWIASKAEAIRCEPNNPQLQYVYYFEDNLAPEYLEALYISLYDRKDKSDWGELHLSESTSVVLAGENILKSNAFIAIDKKWYICSLDKWSGSFSERTKWYLDAASGWTYLTPAITLQTPALADITDLQIGITQSPDMPYEISPSIIRIGDGTTNYKSLEVYRYGNKEVFENNASKLVVKGTGIAGTIKIYGAMVSHIRTSQISFLDLSNMKNLRYLNINNCDGLTSIPGLNTQTLLEYLNLSNNSNLTSVDVKELTGLKTLSISNGSKLEQLQFNTTSLERLSISACYKLPHASLSSLSTASKLILVDIENMDWDACMLDDVYSYLKSPTSAASIYVDNEEYEGQNSNDYAGSNKTIATDKAWAVKRSYNLGAEQTLTGDGGGCSTVGPATLSFTIYPEKSGIFSLWYSTHDAPLSNALQVDWGDGTVQAYSDIAESGSDPSKKIEGTVTVGTPVKIYSKCIEAILISSLVKAIKCDVNNPQLKYIYYFGSNLSSENLEALYYSLYKRSTGDYGELHLSQETSIANAGANILKSNAFMTLDKRWVVCSRKAWTGNFPERVSWFLNENNAKANLIPAITLQSPTLENITDLQISMKGGILLPYILWNSIIRIDDGTDNYKSLELSRYGSNDLFDRNATKLSLKGTGETGLIKIYGALVSQIKTKQISSLDLTNSANLRYLNVENCNKLTSIPGLNTQKYITVLQLSGNYNLTEVDIQESQSLAFLNVFECNNLNKLEFNASNLITLGLSKSYRLPFTNLSSLSSASKLTTIYAENMGWDACTMDSLYKDLKSPAPTDAKIYVENEDYLEDHSNDWAGSNKTIATDKGWTVIRWYNGGAEQSLTGDGGGCIPEGISERDAAKLITLYPNPASEVVNITIGQNLNAESLQVIDITGKTIYLESLTPFESEHQIDVSDYSKGLYLIRIGNTTSKLFVQ